MKVRYEVPILFLFLTCFFACNASSEEVEPLGGWYFRFDSGVSLARDPELRIPEGPLPADLGNSAVLGAGVGQSFVPGLRYEFMITYRSGFEQIAGFANMPEGRAEFQSVLVLASLYLDLYQPGRIVPYAGFGLGIAGNKLAEVRITNVDGTPLGTIDGKTTRSFAWQLCTGFRFDLTNQWMLDAGYRLLSGGDYESEDTLVFTDGTTAAGKDEGRFKAHEFILSVIYTF